MKRWLVYIAFLAAALLIPVQKTDVAKLRPVQVVYLDREDDKVILETDTGDRGIGGNALAALENLKATAPAVIYLDTAKYLLVTNEALADIEILRDHLKESVLLCIAEGEVMREETASYLAVHGQLSQLKQWEMGQPLPVLTELENRLILTKKFEKNA